jgi:hypothetical protein
MPIITINGQPQVVTPTEYSEHIKLMANKYKLADQMRNSMHIPDEFLQYLEIYNLTHWEVPKFKHCLTDGTVLMNGHRIDIKFSVIYYNTTPAAAKAAKEIRLSFRKAKPEFNIEPYVLVQIVSMD